MSLLEVLLVGIGLSMDAFAVSIGKGLAMRRIDVKASLALAVSFGLFQALMPVLGWLLASSFASAIEAIDHWVAFVLLGIVGGKMLVDAIRGEGEEDAPVQAVPGEGAVRMPVVGFGELMMLSVATSIDALAVGISFAALGVSPMPAVVIIGVTTFALSFAGVAIGNRFGSRYERPAGILGGVILILIGLKVLAEHLLGI